MKSESIRTSWKSLTLRMSIPTGMTLLFFFLSFYFIMIPALKRNYLADKQDLLRELNTTVWELLNNYYQRTLTGELTVEEAQHRARERIRALRYGPEGKDYFWINDLHPRMVMHPYLPELEGRDLTTYTDHSGRLMFKNFVDMARTQGAGFVRYDWQWKDNPSLVAPKLSYVRGFEPWGWIIGTGVYLDDIDAQIAHITRSVHWVFAGILLLVGLLSGLIIWQSRQSDLSRQEADQALQRLARILESTSDMVAMATPEGRITYMNSAGRRLLGWPAEEHLSGKTIRDGHPDWAAKLTEEQAIPTAMEQGIWTGETALQDIQGTIRPVSQVIMAHRTPSGEVEYLSTIVRDLSAQYEAERDRRRLEAQVQYAQKLESLGVLAGGIAHDFNNILLAIMGNASLAIDQLPKDHPIRPALTDIETAATRASDLTRQMLAYSGKAHFTQEAIDLSLLVLELLQMLKISISKKAALQTHLPPGLPLIHGDATQIRQVVMNLITNASDALFGQSGVIALSTGQETCPRAFLDRTYLGTSLSEGEYVFVEVRDTGCGMNEETQARIFDPFFTTKFTGRGLGLAAVLGIVRAHKGTLQVQSACGQGTCIKVFFPAEPHLQRPEALPAAKPASPPAQPQHEQLTILVVDDEPAVGIMTRRILEAKGYAVIIARDGLEGVALFKKHAQDIACILMDLTMPRMDGQEAMAEMLKFKPDARIIISSGFSTEQVQEQFTEGGPTSFIMKPYRAAALIEAVETAIRQPPASA